MVGITSHRRGNPLARECHELNGRCSLVKCLHGSRARDPIVHQRVPLINPGTAEPTSMARRELPLPPFPVGGAPSSRQESCRVDPTATSIWYVTARPSGAAPASTRELRTWP